MKPTKQGLKDLYEDVESIWIDIVTAQDDDSDPAISIEDVQDVLERCRDLISHLMETQ
jgi:hypothetical protein